MFVHFIHMQSKVDKNKFEKDMSGERYTEATRSFWDTIIVMSIQAAYVEVFV